MGFIFNNRKVYIMSLLNQLSKYKLLVVLCILTSFNVSLFSQAVAPKAPKKVDTLVITSESIGYSVNLKEVNDISIISHSVNLRASFSYFRDLTGVNMFFSLGVPPFLQSSNSGEKEAYRLLTYTSGLGTAFRFPLKGNFVPYANMGLLFTSQTAGSEETALNGFASFGIGYYLEVIGRLKFGDTMTADVGLQFNQIFNSVGGSAFSDGSNPDSNMTVMPYIGLSNSY